MVPHRHRRRHRRAPTDDEEARITAITAPLDDRERMLDRRVVAVWRLSTAGATTLTTTAAAFAANLLWGRWGAVLIVGLLVSGALTAWYPVAAHSRWRWRVTELALELSHGVVVRRHEALPYFRIQQIDVTHGPLDRLLGLARLDVTSASASGSVSVPGLPAGDAPVVRRELLTRAAAAVRDHEGDVRDAV